jgi:hypothetical protein
MELNKKLKVYRDKRGVSTVFGSMLFLIIIMVTASILFVGLYNHNKATREGTRIEEIRSKEKIVIENLLTDPEIEFISNIEIKNLGSTTVKIAAVYIDNTLLFEPSTSINSKESATIDFPSPVAYNVNSTITVTTDNGVRSTVEEGDLVENYQIPINDEFYFGPLKLDYEEFYYIEIVGDDYDPAGNQPGWNPPASTKLVWNITVTNVDTRDISLSDYSCLTLIDNAGGAQKPWYIERGEHEDGTNSSLILSQESVEIYYRWDNPTAQKNQDTFANDCQCRVILTFFGTFDLPNNKKIPYGQTIPFEAVLIEK